MRMLNIILAFVGALLLSATNFLAIAFASTFPPTRGHLHMLPGAPRSIRDTTRLGLA